MGYTSFTIGKIEGILAAYPIHTVLDLGAQNNYSLPNLPAPYMREWYQERGYDYTSIDINGEHGAIPLDLSQTSHKLFVANKSIVIDSLVNKNDIITASFDLLVDAGTSEHVGRNGAFDWEAIYNCWKTKYDLLKPCGVMYNENPKLGNWPGHGFNYYTQEFYREMEKLCPSLRITDIGEHPAMGNTTDGWNVYCTLHKHEAGDFVTLDEFMTLTLGTNCVR